MKVDLDSLADSIFARVEFFIFCWQPQHTDTNAESWNKRSSKKRSSNKNSKPAPPPFDDSGHHEHFDCFQSPAFWSVTSKSPYTGAGLLRRCGEDSVLFRGYDADCQVHSYSPQEHSERLTEPDKLANGVFAYLKVDHRQNSLTVKTDALGVAPFYYRECNGRYYFASHPALIRLVNDKPDYIAWMSLLQNSSIFGDRSFFRGISRVPAGSQMVIDNSGCHKTRWFDFEQLPTGDAKVTDESFSEVEDACQVSIDKCLKLEMSQRVLPFSSGYDSRRFFASLHHRKLDFKAVTCQCFHQKQGSHYDIDSICAPQIAKSFGQECEVLPVTPVDELPDDLSERLALIGTETFMHGWSLPLFRWLRQQPPSVIFDGLCGDTLGNSGYELPGLHQDQQSDTDILLKQTSDSQWFKQMSTVLPSMDEYQVALKNEIEQLPESLNRAELAFLLFRGRRGISPWITMMQPPGHLTVFPYLDLDFMKACLQYHPAEKYHYFFQKECLERFWPDYADFEGTRKPPTQMSSPDPGEMNLREQVKDEFYYGDKHVGGEIGHLLSFKNRLLWWLLGFFPSLRQKRSWLFMPLAGLIKCSRASMPFLQRQE